MNYREEALQQTEKEIVAEKAATLGRAGERLEAALRLAAELHDALREAPVGGARERARAAGMRGRGRWRRAAS